MLNVLAQRRYRQRRKEHVQKLEAQASNANPPDSSTPSPQDQITQGTVETSCGGQVDTALPTQPLFEPSAYFEQIPLEDDQLYPLETSSRGQSLISQQDPFAAYDAGPFASPPENQLLWDTSVRLTSLTNTPLSSSSCSSSNQSTNWSLVSLLGPSRPPEEANSPQSTHPAVADQDLQYSFPDEAHLEMTELTLLRGCMAIARRMNIHELIWSFTSTSPFTDPSMALAQFTHLPVNLQPTLLQMTITHHPVIDLLPWPSVRDKLIQVLSQPPEVRPSGAVSPMALLDFVYDLEDSAEGVRIFGSDPYSGQSWELGEKVFQGWWWVFDKDIIRRSNELRASRGAPMLGMGSVLGEVA